MVFWAFHVVILAALDRPDEQQPSRCACAKREEYEDKDAPHQGVLARREFPTTVRELKAMAAAAMIGCSTPATATGIMMML